MNEAKELIKKIKADLNADIKKISHAIYYTHSALKKVEKLEEILENI